MSLKLLAMLNKNIPAIRSRVARFHYSSVSGGVYRCASRCGVVGPSMWALCFIDGVESVGVEVRADPREVQRRPQKCFSHADTFFVVVAGVALKIGIAIGLERLTTVGKTGR